MKAKWVKGSLLSNEMQRAVLGRYVHRFTNEHRPDWANREDCSHCVPQYNTDFDWLKETAFAVKDDGALDERVTHCEPCSLAFARGEW